MKAIKHLFKILKHKRWVFHYCRKIGMTWVGIKHDMSKFSPIEFWESVKYYQGNRSPIDACKEDKGYSMAWLHHKGRNPHHYEYWQDNFDNGTDHLQMPYRYAAEMICDYLAAGRAYNGKEFSFAGEYEWWKKQSPIRKNAMHPQTHAFVDRVMKELMIANNAETVLNALEYIYNEEDRKFKRG